MEKLDQHVTSKLEALIKYGTDITQMAKQNKLDPVIGRRDEIERVTQILCKRRKNNVCLTGDPGVGKTVIVEGLASRIINGSIPSKLQETKVFSIDMARLLAGASNRGEFEERLTKVVDEVKLSEGKIVLFIDELHTLVGAGSSGPLDASNILKPALARGELKCIGATTMEEYRKYIEKDGALKRRFQVVDVPEPSVEDTVLILKGLVQKYESFHKVKYTDKAILSASSLAKQYVSERFLPDKAIDLIDEAGARVSLQQKQDKYDKVTVATKMDTNLRVNLQAQQGQTEYSGNMLVTEEDIKLVLSSWTGIPIEKMSQEEVFKLLNMEKTLQTKMIGQKEAVMCVSRAIRRAKVGIRDPNRPIASFLFTGPTGVGKTELAKLVAQEYFGTKDAMVRVDMSEYMEKHEVSKLFGSPPGYVGHDNGGQLTETIRRKPHNLVLFDEIEKAHRDVFNAMLQILDDGRLTDGKGRVVDFKNTIIILTSNIGGHLDGKFEQVKVQVSELLKAKFSPEFLNRLDDVIVFKHLKKKHLRMIVALMLKEFIERVKEKKEILIKVTDKVREKVIEEGYSPSYGARPLRRAITRILEDNLCDKILSGHVKEGDKVTVDVNLQGEIIFKDGAIFWDC
ncbi:Chaperone protein ClpC3, chloroplastic [Heracleum sosnowskyi]|uniref:Chaperone protein ClpC3, chloroplastic n=1 Tax=Heracleum sosnowskyi TaxID=360622 RepID=A0AAD8H2U4_9APIA|nr:Chaperone protein ClpC3, chloroplastic [Heracleum sosnowskyi]